MLSRFGKKQSEWKELPLLQCTIKWADLRYFFVNFMISYLSATTHPLNTKNIWHCALTLLSRKVRDHPCLYSLGDGVIAQWLGRWIPSQGVLCSKPLFGLKFNSPFHLSQFNWALGIRMHLLLKNKLSPWSGSVTLRQLNSIQK